MNLPAHSRVLFIGDSITDCSRGPSGEANAWEPNFGLGQGYVSMIHAWLGATYPEAGIRVSNRGISGNTVRDLAARWERDVLAEKPDTLCVMVGINDVWRQFDMPERPEAGVGRDEYRALLAKLVADAQVGVRGIYLASPYFIDPNRSDPMRALMDDYGQSVREIAAEVGATFVDTQAAFDHLLKHMHSVRICGDRIHPGPVGHMAIAQAFLRSFGCL